MDILLGAFVSVRTIRDNVVNLRLSGCCTAPQALKTSAPRWDFSLSRLRG